jgi:hypothetical protein
MVSKTRKPILISSRLGVFAVQWFHGFTLKIPEIF